MQLEAPKHGIWQFLCEPSFTCNPELASLYEQEKQQRRTGLLLPDASQHLLGLRATVFETIAVPLEQRGVPAAEIATKVKELTQQLGIDHLLERDPAQLSGGETRKVALATVLITQPELLLAQDLFLGLDVPSRERILGLLQGLPAVLLAGSQLIDAVPCLNDDDQQAIQIPAPVTAGSADLQVQVEASRGFRPKRWWRKEQPARFVAPQLTLELRPGAVLWLQGPNGAGKSTILQLLAGMDHLGAATWSKPCTRALTLQNSADQVLFSTVEQMVPVSELREKLLPGVDAQVHPLDLSPAQLRLCQLAAALAKQTDVLLLDEPDVGQDAAASALFLAAVHDSLAAGGQVLLACHESAFVELLEQFCEVDRVTLKR